MHLYLYLNLYQILSSNWPFYAHEQTLDIISISRAISVAKQFITNYAHSEPRPVARLSFYLPPAIEYYVYVHSQKYYGSCAQTGNIQTQIISIAVGVRNVLNLQSVNLKIRYFCIT